MKKLDYISILAGGSCKFACSFCVGNSIRENITPHISKKYVSFIKCFGDLTNSISISGSTSDPYFLDIQYHKEIINACDEVNKKLIHNLHTRQIKDEIKIRNLIEMYNGTVFSIDETFLSTENLINFKDFSHKKLRFSIVITKENKDIFNREWLDKVSELTGINSFTFRPDVFNHKESISVFGFAHKMKFDYNITEENHNYGNWFPYKDKFVTFWDNNKINQNVRYLWSDGNITSDCEWKKLY